jgi:hypothetical protein
MATTLTKTTNQGNFYLNTGSIDEYTKGNNIVQNGLIYYMDPAKPESYSGGTTVRDMTRTNPVGTLVGGFSYSAQKGGIITLDGATGYIDTGVLQGDVTTGPFTANSAFTMSIWVNFYGPQEGILPHVQYGQSALFANFNYNGFGISWESSASYDGIPAYVNGWMRTNAGSFTTSAHYPSLNTWYNYVYVYSSSLLSNINALYTNGTLTSNVAATSGPYNTSAIGPLGTVQIGSSEIPGGVGTGTAPIYVGQALIYNRALSATEINQNFQEMRSQYGV